MLSAVLVGVLAMSTDAPAQEKKDPTKDASYDEKVSVRRFEGGKLATGVVKNVPAFRYEAKDGVLKFYTKPLTAATPTKGTEITDEKGNVYVVEKVVVGGFSDSHLSTVKEKPKPK